jgi:NAD dependent epimerase/dehydratase family enzyme
MRILITGATGPVGRALTQLLLDQGLRPRIVTRRPHRALEFFDSRVLAFEWHPRTEPLPRQALDGVERVIHLMGDPLYGPMTRERRAQIVASRRNGTLRLAEALGQQQAHVIVASSVAVYGFAEGPPLTETTPVQNPRGRIAQTLLACEEAAEQLRDNGSVVTIVRLGPVIGPGGFPEDLLRVLGRRFAWADTHADAAVPAIDVLDAASLLAWLALSKPMPGAVHGVAPEPLRTADLKQLLIEAAPATRLNLPRALMRRRAGLVGEFLYSRQRILPQRALDAGFKFGCPDPLESVRSVLAQLASAAPPAKRRGSLLGAMLQRSQTSQTPS